MKVHQNIVSRHKLQINIFYLSDSSYFAVRFVKNVYSSETLTLQNINITQTF